MKRANAQGTEVATALGGSAAQSLTGMKQSARESQRKPEHRSPGSPTST